VHVDRSAGGDFRIDLRDELDKACSVEHAVVVDRVYEPPMPAVDLPPQFEPEGSLAGLGRTPTGQIDGRDDSGIGQEGEPPVDASGAVLGMLTSQDQDRLGPPGVESFVMWPSVVL
jgi:hypothetical protein